jgi:hypothetical protein
VPGYPDDDGDLIAWAEDCGPVTLEAGRSIFVWTMHGSTSSVCFVSQDAEKSRCKSPCVAPARFMSIQASRRLALVATGEERGGGFAERAVQLGLMAPRTRVRGAGSAHR